MSGLAGVGSARLWHRFLLMQVSPCFASIWDFDAAPVSAGFMGELYSTGPLRCLAIISRWMPSGVSVKQPWDLGGELFFLQSCHLLSSLSCVVDALCVLCFRALCCVTCRLQVNLTSAAVSAVLAVFSAVDTPNWQQEFFGLWVWRSVGLEVPFLPACDFTLRWMSRDATVKPPRDLGRNLSSGSRSIFCLRCVVSLRFVMRGGGVPLAGKTFSLPLYPRIMRTTSRSTPPTCSRSSSECVCVCVC